MYILFSSVSCVRLFVTPWTAACQASLSNSWSLSKLMSIKPVMLSNHLILLCPLLLLPPIPPSIRVFSNESVLHISWPKIWSFSISPSNESPLGLTGCLSFQSQGTSRIFSNTKFRSINSSALNFLYSPTLTSIHDYWKNHRLD